jgi:hypothetical protein
MATHRNDDNRGAPDGARETEMNAETEPDNEFASMSEQDFETFLADALDDYADENDVPLRCVATFADAGVLTSNTGLVVRVGDAEFQVTIVRGR